MTRLWAFLAGVTILHSIGFSMSDSDVFKKLVPEFIFCFDFVNLRSNEELVEIMTNFPENVRTRQQKCFLRCLLRRHQVFLEPTGTRWCWQNAVDFLMSFGFTAGRKSFIKSSLFFCVKKKKQILSKFGCKNAFNFFRCLTRHGMSFKGDRMFWALRQQYLMKNPYGSRDMNQKVSANQTASRPQKVRPSQTLASVFYDADDSNNSVRMGFNIHDTVEAAFTDLLTTDVGEGIDENYDGDDEEEMVENNDDGGEYDNDDDLDDDNVDDNPSKITASKPFRRERRVHGTMGAYPGHQFVPNRQDVSSSRSYTKDKRKTFTVTIPDIASQANTLSVKWADMTTSD